ncbi:hypothetical protein AB3X91_41425, partial [Paraburkholderia sp. BR14263]|uniref:hypothetical protein n=1 Tax=unclassified Paraburkholderia TaxID=2615204 RepID=UPI0034CDCFD3
NSSTPMIVRIARVKVGNRQAPYAVTSRTPVSPKENRGSGVWAPERTIIFCDLTYSQSIAKISKSL